MALCSIGVKMHFKLKVLRFVAPPVKQQKKISKKWAKNNDVIVHQLWQKMDWEKNFWIGLLHDLGERDMHSDQKLKTKDEKKQKKILEQKQTR